MYIQITCWADERSSGVYFRRHSLFDNSYGNSLWEQALFSLEIFEARAFISVTALPSPGYFMAFSKDSPILRMI